MDDVDSLIAGLRLELADAIRAGDKAQQRAIKAELARLTRRETAVLDPEEIR